MPFDRQDGSREGKARLRDEDERLRLYYQALREREIAELKKAAEEESSILEHSSGTLHEE